MAEIIDTSESNYGNSTYLGTVDVGKDSSAEESIVNLLQRNGLRVRDVQANGNQLEIEFSVDRNKSQDDVEKAWKAATQKYSDANLRET